ncbi:MAG: hypothetical protein H0U44_06390 [Flavisolibacter sp.]|nr:hypothetical protein [Flavisolibacter sp.]
MLIVQQGRQSGKIKFKSAMENIFWTAYTQNERHSTIEKIKNVIKNHGDIIDFKLFSDVSINMTIEIEESKIDSLYDALRELIAIDKFEYLKSISKLERTIYLNITFAKGTGNLSIEAPNFPG